MRRCGGPAVSGQLGSGTGSSAPACVEGAPAVAAVAPSATQSFTCCLLFAHGNVSNVPHAPRRASMRIVGHRATHASSHLFGFNPLPFCFCQLIRTCA